MKDNIKIALLAIISITLIYDTFLDHEHETKHENHNHAAEVSTPNSPTSTPDFNATPAIPQEPIGPTTSIAFEEEVYDFGKIKQETENKHIFKFTNTGQEPLVISNARGSCGCTVPKYPKEPIPPGATGEIEVVYSPGKQKGVQAKTVTVTANTEPATTQFKITAEVEEIAN